MHAPALPEAAHIAAHRASLQKSWQTRRKWSRTDSARHLNDRSEPLLALLRRRPGSWPKHTHQIGYWLREHNPSLFNRAHAMLAAAPGDSEREILLPGELV